MVGFYSNNLPPFPNPDTSGENVESGKFNPPPEHSPLILKV